jgi:hypothetical protein
MTGVLSSAPASRKIPIRHLYQPKNQAYVFWPVKLSIMSGKMICQEFLRQRDASQDFSPRLWRELAWWLTYVCT